MTQAQIVKLKSSPFGKGIVNLRSTPISRRSHIRRKHNVFHSLHGISIFLLIRITLLSLTVNNGPKNFFAVGEGVNYYNADGANNAYYDLDDAVDEDDAENMDDDDVDFSEKDFDQVSLMPVSCVSYMGGFFVKFELFDSNGNFQCHTKNFGTFIVSITHYMRAYFNYQALVRGQNFKLPSDASYLNCIQLSQTYYADQALYGKIGCQERETYTSTKLKLHVYTDAQCSVPYEDGENSDRAYRQGYKINDEFFSSKVSFRPPFYSCLTCKPDEISDTFSKQGTYWYDDDNVANGRSQQKYDDVVTDDDQYWDASTYANKVITYKDDDDDFYGNGDDDTDDARLLRKSNSITQHFTPIKGTAEKFEKDFWHDHETEIKNTERKEIGRKLEDEEEVDDAAVAGDDQYNGVVQYWNMCQRLYKYGIWCDADCRALDTFRVDQWSTSDIFLLGIMCLFMGAMMLLIFAKRVKAYEKESSYGGEINTHPGLPPIALGVIFLCIYAVIVTLFSLRYVNETLVAAVVSCILLFIYMLKLTLFESQKKRFSLARNNRNYYANGNAALGNRNESAYA